MRLSIESFRRNAILWLRQGVSPRRLAFSVALGCAVGCIPVVGIPTLLCAGLAFALGLNLPAIQAANYAVMPLQLVLIVPFVRLGGWLFSRGPQPSPAVNSLLHMSPLHMVTQLGSLAVEAMFAWLLIAGPAVLLLTFGLTRLFVRIPAFSRVESAN
jgi:uncharacterized protein (DUF2062 family)